MERTSPIYDLGIRQHTSRLLWDASTHSVDAGPTNFGGRHRQIYCQHGGRCGHRLHVVPLWTMAGQMMPGIERIKNAVITGAVVLVGGQVALLILGSIILWKVW